MNPPAKESDACHPLKGHAYNHHQRVEYPLSITEPLTSCLARPIA